MMKPLPDEFAEFDEQIAALHREVEANTDPAEIGRAAARLYVERIRRIRFYSERLHDTFASVSGFLPFKLEENIPLLNTMFRMFGELNTMFISQINGLLNCFGGPAVIGLQHLQVWAGGDQSRQQFVLELIAKTAERAKTNRSPRKKN